MNASAPRVAVPARNLVGESPVWSVAEQALYWVDVEGKRVQRWDPATNRVRHWDMGEATGSIGLRRGGGLVAAIRTGFVFLDTETGTLRPIADPESDKADTRFNDGKVDRRGRFWAGTRNFRDHSRADGCLYRLDPQLSIHRLLDGIRCPNGIAWSPDDRTMYLCDTWIRCIFAFDFDADEGVPHNRRLFKELFPEQGYPDGLTVDSEGFLWNAHYDGWRITRYAPDGRVDRIIAMPVQHVTSLAFGGPGLRTLFVTSSHLRLTDAARAAQPLAGHVFALEAVTAGIAEPSFAG
ncbi:MAG TPA: SMP-30/gluconolactonase/LRE family protein [Burkholderiales bacterium]|nr:SMP-30/gluconolactonase/LRE family protein [Burkholderiales bacterium]